MNFIETFKFGQSDAIKGIPYGKGLEKITLDTNGVSKGKIIGVAGPEKSGKSTFADYAFVIQPYLYSLQNNVPIKWVYYSFEIDRVSKEYDFAVFFLNHDYGVNEITLPQGITRKGINKIQLSPEYLKGNLLDDNNHSIKIHPNLKDLVKQVYENRIIPLFGEFAQNGVRIKKGLITFIEGKENPTGIYKDLLSLASREGTFTLDSKGKKIGYKTNVEGELKYVIIDHIRKLKVERGWQLKQTIDKMSEYMVELRNLLQYVFIPIIHTNRNLSSTDKLAYFKGDLYPTSDDLKDTGNLGEDCNYLFTIFNPNDDKYSLKDHFDLKIRDSKGNILYPYLRTIHLVSSRHCEFPKHYKINMIGNIKKFESIQ